MKRVLLLAITGALLACSPPANQSAETTTVAAAETTASTAPLADYVQAVAMADMYEVEAGRLASTRGRDQRVRAFGQQMVTDHTATTQGLQAALHSVPNAPAPPPALDQRHQQMLQELRDAPAANFDERYVDQQVAAHTEALATHQGYAASGDVQSVQAFAAETAPKVQHHLDMIREIDNSSADEPRRNG